MHKLWGENGLKLMEQLISNVYETTEWPKDFIEVTVFALKKNPKATKFSDHCIISLIPHAVKRVEGILRRRTEDILRKIN